jgi:ribosomal protein S27E
MTILCVTTTGLPGVRPCTTLGEHRVNCWDHPGWTINPGTCRGCLPRAADRGYLCQPCNEQVEAAYFAWAPWLRLVAEAGARAVSPDGGGGATPDGYTNLSLTMLAVDECARLLASRRDRTLDLWVHDQDGAADAIRFAHAAQAAYRTLQVEEREAAVRRERCPNCEHLTVYGHRSEQQRGSVVVTCEWCGFELAKIRTTLDPTASHDCLDGDHGTCARLGCRCACHDLGRRSTAQGIGVLWDGDQHAAGFVDRAAWVFDGETIRQHDERKTA